MSSDIRITLIVCTYHRPSQVQRLLDCIGEQTRIPDETLIVDSSPDRDTENVVLGFGAKSKVLNLKHYKVPLQHRGLTWQRNYGVAHAKGDLVAFLDDDTLPQPDYFAQILACFERHPEAVGVGGFINNEVQWRRTNGGILPSHSFFGWGDWERREAYRWRLRKLLGLVSSLPPGWLPESGHGRSVGCLPPDGQDYKVEFLMGCSFTWRTEIFQRHQFSLFFAGYGLYEDLDFCIRASREAPLYLCTRAQLAHYHAPAGRPNLFRYGVMVVRNGWFVWRRRWPSPPRAARLRWWTTTILLTLCRVGDAVRGPQRRNALADAIGRLWGMARLFFQDASHN